MTDFEIIKNQLTKEDIYLLLTDLGGEPEYTKFGIISTTICHNPPHQGSRKLYYYENKKIFHCYTDCGNSFDIFELIRKVYKIQKNKELSLYQALHFISLRFGFSSGKNDNSFKEDVLSDSQIFNEYIRVKNLNHQFLTPIILKEYDSSILNNLNYSLKLKPWLDEKISNEVLQQAKIGYYLGGDQISIPHFDVNNRFIGLRGRSMCKADCELYGKYRPLYINQTLYSHPLGLNLYNLNLSKDNIQMAKIAIVFESEKSTLLYKTYFGVENDISVACCGSNLSQYQIFLLQQLGVKEIVVAFDRQFQEIGDNEFQHLKRNLLKLYEHNHINLTFSFIFDKSMITSYKASPIDEGKDKFLKLFNERIML